MIGRLNISNILYVLGFALLSISLAGIIFLFANTVYSFVKMPFSELQQYMTEMLIKLIILALLLIIALLLIAQREVKVHVRVDR